MSNRNDKFAWHAGDIEIEPGPHWDLSYEQDGYQRLVQDADELMQHLRQHGGEDDLQGALEAFLDSPRARLMPESIWRELEAMGVLEDATAHGRPRPSPPPDGIPFDAYPDAGRVLLGPPAWGDGTARHSYGRRVHEWCGFRCAYCGLDLGTFEGWLQLSIDHVVPQQMAKSGWPREWVLDLINVVASCMACNGLFNRDPAAGEPPTSLDGFLAVRDEMFTRRRARILERRQGERSFFEDEIAPSVSSARRRTGR